MDLRRSWGGGEVTFSYERGTLYTQHGDRVAFDPKWTHSSLSRICNHGTFRNLNPNPHVQTIQPQILGPDQSEFRTWGWMKNRRVRRKLTELFPSLKQVARLGARLLLLQDILRPEILGIRQVMGLIS